MSETETSKKSGKNVTDVMKGMAAATLGGISSGGVGPMILWGGGLAVATAIAAFSIKKKKKKQSVRKSEGASKKKGSMITDIEEECINRFRLALHNSSQSLHYNAWSPLSLTKMKIHGQEIVSTRYLITEDKIVLQVEWREENSSNSSKEEMVLFDSLRRAKVTTSDDHSALQMLSVSADDYASKDPLGAIIQTIKNNPKALEQIANSKQEQGGGRDEEKRHEDGKSEHTEQKEESPMEENQKRRDGFDVDADEEISEQGNSLIPKERGTAKASVVQKTIHDMRMQIWVILLVLVVLILLLSPKLLTQ